MEEKLKELTRLYDTAKILYANAIYAIISGNKIFEECIDEFKDYMLENL